MSQGARTAITVSVLGLVLVVAAIWGWGAATEPLPGRVTIPVCVDRTVPAGTKVFPEDVTVSVYNAGTREGLAARVMQELTDAGFTEATSTNAAPTVRVGYAQIWTEEPENPAVRLVASRLGPRVVIERRESAGLGVTVVVGDSFESTREGRPWTRSDQDATICSPPVDPL